MGLLYVSAGLFLNNRIIEIAFIIVLIKIFKIMVDDKNGIPINITVEDKRQIQLLVACSPKENNLIPLYIRRNISTSFPIFNINEHVIITKSLVINKYIEVKPYFSLSCSSIL